ncbi:MAG TPA: FecR domain-containing protein [Sphingobacteriaceae bacterium]
MSRSDNLSELKRIIQKYLSGKSTPEEEEFLRAYYQYFESQDDFVNMLTADERQRLEAEMETALLQRIAHPEDGKIRKIITRIAVAASLIIFIASSTYFILRSGSRQTQVKVHKVPDKDVLPGGNHAVLTLSDGTIIVLNSAKNGMLAQQGNIAVNKAADGQLVYDLSGPDNSALTTRPGYNTISTPAGGQYQVILPDGSKVWLNSESSLKFPVVFTGGERHAELTGEGYFEVAKNEKSPFTVTVNKMKVEVLGTHFNIMAYTDEASVNTTLLEGSVRILKGKERAMLTPGQQARVSTNINVENADIQEAVGWKEGYFIFKNEELRSVMRKLSRWYNVDVKYEGEIPVTVFGGRISRYKNISQVLKLLELTGAIHFKIENASAGENKAQILVMP